MTLCNKEKLYGPVAIGGVGGSGTRVVAEILKQLGFYIGKDLNYACDNLWFTLLFKRPKWFLENSNNQDSHIFKGLNIFEKAMLGSLRVHREELNFILKAAREMILKGHNYLGSGSGLWSMKRVISLVYSKKPDLSRYIGWGWKEPNTHIYIEYLNRHFENLKYIHVIRNGMDMAFSNNQAQLYNWGMLFGIKIDKPSVLLPKLSLKYWNAANRRAITLGQKLLNERFLVINFEQLCMNPRQEIESLVDFLKIDRGHADIDELAKLPRLPKSAGRYKEYDLSIFDRDDIEGVKALGFMINS